MLHHTTDPTQRAQDITDHLQQEHEQELVARGQDPYHDWEKHWLTTYHQVRTELTQVPTDCSEPSVPTD